MAETVKTLAVKVQRISDLLYSDGVRRGGVFADDIIDDLSALIAEIEVNVIADANELSITDKIRAAIDGNVTALSQLDAATTNVTTNVITPTATNLTQANAQIDALATVVNNLLTQSGRMMRQITAMERLLIGSDLLESDAGT